MSVGLNVSILANYLRVVPLNPQGAEVAHLLLAQCAHVARHRPKEEYDTRLPHW